MAERTVTFLDNPLHLVGGELTQGQTLPDFTLLDTDLNPVAKSEFAGKPLVLVAVPSLDTSVCDIEARRFDKEAGSLSGANVVVASMDLPFAQKRWVAQAGVQHIQVLSDYKDAAFGPAFGILIQELRLLARAVFVADAQGKVTYVQVVPEVTHEPDYDAAVAAARALL